MPGELAFGGRRRAGHQQERGQPALRRRDRRALSRVGRAPFRRAVALCRDGRRAARRRARRAPCARRAPSTSRGRERGRPRTRWRKNEPSSPPRFNREQDVPRGSPAAATKITKFESRLIEWVRGSRPFRPPRPSTPRSAGAGSTPSARASTTRAFCSVTRRAAKRACGARQTSPTSGARRPARGDSRRTRGSGGLPGALGPEPVRAHVSHAGVEDRGGAQEQRRLRRDAREGRDALPAGRARPHGAAGVA
jgi:hypothetical protein